MLRRLFEPVDIAPLVYARIVFGVSMAVEVARYFEHGWIASYFVTPKFFFAYPGFEWVRPLPGSGMYAVFVVAGLAAVGVASGRYYRPAALTLAVCWTWVFFCDQTNYLNHGWLLCLLAWLFAFVPADRKTATVPRWAFWLIGGQLALVYFFGAVAKIDADWFSGDVARFFLSRHDATRPLAESDLGRKLFAVAGFSFDLLIVPALMWRRTRWPATLAAASFHLTNAWLFKIGVFPWVMLAMTPVFWPASHARAALSRLGLLKDEPAPPSPWSPAIAALFIAWFVVQAALPLRHWLYRGQVNWTEEGHNFSWHMKLRVKRGETRFWVGGAVHDPRELLTKRQVKKMATRPEMIRQLAVELRRRYGGEVRVDARASLNGRPMQPLIDPTVDLGVTERTLGAARWIVPLQGEAGAGADADDDSD